MWRIDYAVMYFSTLLLSFSVVERCGGGSKGREYRAENNRDTGGGYGKGPSPEDIFHYVYAVLYSEKYRHKYAEFLRTDFPRVPFTKDHKLFLKAAGYGERLAELHLLKSRDLDKPAVRFQGKGGNRVEKPIFDEEEGRVYINTDQYFEGVAKDSWSYMIGGYQVLEKWLKDRRKRVLSLNDIRHYCRTASAIKKTIEIQKELDIIFPEIEKSLLEFC